MRLILILCLLTNVAFSQQPDVLKKHVEYLASPELEGRRSGTPGCDKAAEYIKQQLMNFGYTPEIQEFKKGKYNVLSTSKAQLDSVIVIGGHYDHMGRKGNNIYYGADDNASGVAITLELARIFTTSRNKMVFILFAGEEQGMEGSEYYVKHPKYPLTKHIFMLNLDMVGHLKSNRFKSSPNIPGILQSLYSKYPFAQDITLRGREDVSDNAPFGKHNIPFAFIHTGLTQTYHKPNDTADTLNYDGMAQILQYTTELIRLLDTYDLPDYNIVGANYDR